MKKIYSIAIFVLIADLIFGNASFGQAVGDYRSNADGNWNALGTWERLNALPSTWATPTAVQGYPGQNSGTGAVTIIGNDDVIINVSVPNAIASLTIGDASGTNESVAFRGTSAFTLSVTGSVILNDGDLTVTNQAGAKTHILNIGSNLTVGSTSTFDGASTDDYLNVILNGTGAQTIGGTLTSIPFQDLTISNSSGGVSLGTDITINGGSNFGTMTFTSGVLTATSTNTLTFNDGAIVAGASNSSYVDGPVTKIGNDDFIFPLGDPLGSYHPCAINNTNVVNSSATNGDSYTAEYVRASGSALGPITVSGLYGVSNCEYWRINRASGAGNPNVRLYWTTSSPCSGPYITNLIGLQVSGFNGTNWNNSAGAGVTAGSTTSAGSVNRNTLFAFGNGTSTFSSFTIGNVQSNGSPLPVKFGSIRAYSKNNGVQVEWTTLTELNVDHYDVERSTNGTQFYSISQAPALNNGNRADYNRFDPSPVMGTNFYRIRSVDIDGKITYSIIVRVDFGKPLTDINIFPNPVKGTVLSLQAPELVKGNYSVKIYGNTGQLIVNQRFNHNGGSVSQSVQLPGNMRPGTYVLELQSEGNSFRKAFIVQ